MAILLSRHWSLGSLVLDIDYTSSYISCDNACLLRMTSTPKKASKVPIYWTTFLHTCVVCNWILHLWRKKCFFKCHVYDETLPPPIFTSKYHNFFLALFICLIFLTILFLGMMSNCVVCSGTDMAPTWWLLISAANLYQDDRQYIVLVINCNHS